MKKIIVLTLLCLLPAFYSCTRDALVVPNDPVDSLTFAAYILNEGSFSAGSGSLSIYDILAGTFNHPVNSSFNLFPNGLKYENGLLYVTAQGPFNGAGNIYKLDSLGNTISSSAAGINPYSLAIWDNKIFVTNGPSNSVTVIDKNTLGLITTIPAGNNPQEITAANGKVYVCNIGSFASPDSTVTVIDVSSNSVITTLDVSPSPAGISVNVDGNIMVACMANTNANVYYINPVTNAIFDTDILTNGFTRELIAETRFAFYYFISTTYGSGGITKLLKYDMSTGDETILIQALTSEGEYYGLGNDNRNLKLYLGQAASDYSSPGKIYKLSQSGSIEQQFTGGVNPRRIVVNYRFE